MCEFLEEFVMKSNGIVLVIDAYCLYNRARGVSLVYPQDFIDACNLFHELKLPLKLRKFRSGLLAIQTSNSNFDHQKHAQYEPIIPANGSNPNPTFNIIPEFSKDKLYSLSLKCNDMFISRILEIVSSFGSISFIEYAAIDNLPLTLATELLLCAESAQILCRDEVLEEIRFYLNIFYF
ncbi:Vacuolar protein-sorting-associated protein 36 [Smittium culicis]|uniref:Vacuolar protein-sorting-associated protein 36 n=1 Tax=Smittium culicis TaxID=133412 RepID=A0A1R1XGB6_9FUNG|nr:Vacuolar protein-sorting-associated protein 36 [Smittium culicis]